jgi:putative peptidoglycan lipid II flippase
VWTLIAPASVGLYVLATPVIALLFQHGAFTAESTAYTAAALRAAVPGLLFAAIDMPLIFAFYARRDTRTPTLIGVASTVFYLALVAGLARMAETGTRAFTLENLILANSLKTGVDAVLMGFFLGRKIGGLNGYSLKSTAIKVTAASLLMGVGVWVVMEALLSRFSLDSLVHDMLVALGAAAAGVAIYALCATVLRIPELLLVLDVVRRKLGRSGQL